MALAEPVKKGGRYTKKQQEERRLQVHQLYFEENKPAVKIAELLDVNRNTISNDIQFWFNQFENSPQTLDVNSKMKNQIKRMEIQRDRLFGYLEKTETLDEKIKLERFISDIDNRLAQFFSKAMFGKKENLPPSIKFDDDIKEDKIKDFVIWIIKASKDLEYEKISEDEIKGQMIWVTKSDKLFADAFFRKMIDFGLIFCKSGLNYSDNFDLRNQDNFDLGKFAEIRGYFTIQEMEERKKQHAIEKETKSNQN